MRTYCLLKVVLAEDHLRVDVSLRRALGSPNAVDRA